MANRSAAKQSKRKTNSPGKKLDRSSKKKAPRAQQETFLREERKKIPLNIRTIVLTEAGYRCAVPRCRNILALQLHHMHQVAYGGGDSEANLIALCPTCHALYHLGQISVEAIYSWKAMLVALSRAFDLDAIDRLLFLEPLSEDFLIIQGDGVLHFSRLIAAGLANVKLYANNNGLIVTYAVNISEKGRMIISAWREGDQTKLKIAVGGPVTGLGEYGTLPA